MTAPYTPETIGRMRTMARERMSLRAVADELGWDALRTARVAKTHGIELAGRADAETCSPTVASSHGGVSPSPCGSDSSAVNPRHARNSQG